MSTQMKDKVVPNNSQVNDKKTKVEDHPRITSNSNKIKFLTACDDSLKSRSSNVNAVCATCEKCLVDSDHFDCVTKLLNDVNARNKKPKIVPISTKKPKVYANKSIARAPKKQLHQNPPSRNPRVTIECFMRKLFAPILGYGDLVKGDITINRVYYVKGLNHNVFLVGQFCDADLEVSFWKSTYFVRDLQGNDLLTGSHGSDLYTISFQENDFINSNLSHG
nr:integrase, catalytic region, zinc finger, CCHC-type, peptidase aspartic, catalytic [Tanacetum cinerariifolium]